MIPLLEMSNAEYHGDTSRISKSGLDLIARSPLHYWQKYLAPDRKPEAQTPALIMGTAMHAAILEPAAFDAGYCVAPVLNKRTNEGKAAWEKFVADNAGRVVLDLEDYETAQRTRDAVFNHPAAAALLGAGRPEGTLHFTHPETQAACKVRMDFLHESEDIVLDVKSTEDASPAAFAKSVANYRYNVQGAYYLDGIHYAGHKAPRRFVLLAVEKKPPYGVALYYLDNEAIEVGRELYLENLQAYARATHTGEWAGYSTIIEPLTLPAWALKRI